MGGRMKIGEWMDGRKKEETNKWMEEWMEEWMDRWKNGWMDEKKDLCVSRVLFFKVLVHSVFQVTAQLSGGQVCGG